MGDYPDHGGLWAYLWEIILVYGRVYQVLSMLVEVGRHATCGWHHSPGSGKRELSSGMFEFIALALDS